MLFRITVEEEMHGCVVVRRQWRLAACVGLLCLSAIVFCPAPVGAQTQVSTIQGKVKDENGGVLPGVTVTLRGPALQVPEMVAVTGPQGDYRLSPLPIGTCSLHLEVRSV